jgi:hypothetical protein
MMKLKTILLGVALAGVTLIAPSNLVQAQVCPRLPRGSGSFQGNQAYSQ